MLSYSRIIPAKSIKGKAPSLFSSFKGASFLPPSFSGSMALEGALVLPLFLLFLFTLLYSLEIVRFQSDLYAAVHQSGSKICFYSYQDKFAQEESGNNAGTAKGEIRDRLEKEILPFLCVEKGREGVVIHVEKTVSGDVRITTACSMKPFMEAEIFTALRQMISAPCRSDIYKHLLFVFPRFPAAGIAHKAMAEKSVLHCYVPHRQIPDKGFHAAGGCDPDIP